MHSANEVVYSIKKYLGTPITAVRNFDNPFFAVQNLPNSYAGEGPDCDTNATNYMSKLMDKYSSSPELTRRRRRIK